MALFPKQILSNTVFLDICFSHDRQHVKKIFIFMKHKQCNINSENKIAATLLLIPTHDAALINRKQFLPMRLVSNIAL